MGFERIVSLLGELPCPVARVEFDEDAPPAPPFVVWFESSHTRRPEMSNGQRAVREVNASIELYTDIAETAAPERERIEKLIEHNVLSGVDFDKYQTQIYMENMVQTAYEFTIVEKRY